MKYSFEFKVKAVKSYLKTGCYTRTKIDSNNSTYRHTVRKWVRLYRKHGFNGLKHKSHKYFGIDEKIKVIKKYYDGNSIWDLAIILGIEHTIVSNWIKKYEKYGKNGLIDKPKGRKPKNHHIKINKLKVYDNSLIEKVRHIEDLRKKSKIKLNKYLKENKISKSTYHYNLKRKTYEEKNDYLYFAIKKIFDSSNHTYGINRIKIALVNEYGLIVNKKKITRIMKDQNLKVKLQKGKYKSYKGKRGKICKNLIQRNFNASNPLQKLTTDVTEFNLPFGKVYLQSFLDMYNEEILCYQISTNTALQQTRSLFNKLKKKYKDKLQNAIFHSDQGWQYQTSWYQKEVKKLGCLQSMSRKGNCLDNSVMENFFGRLKMEMFYGNEYKFKNFNHFKMQLEKYIYYYNNSRIKTKFKTSPILYRLNKRSANASCETY